MKNKLFKLEYYEYLKYKIWYYCDNNFIDCFYGNKYHRIINYNNFGFKIKKIFK